MALEIQNLSKTYSNGVKAMDGIQLKIDKGMFGLLGPNGAGKSTLMRTIATLQNPDEGTILFNDQDIKQDARGFRKILGYLPQSFGVYPKQSAKQLLGYLAILKGISNSRVRLSIIEEVLELTNLSEHANKYVESYSGGMKQRFGIAQLLLNNPKLIIVDEPTAGLDPEERNRFLNVLRRISHDNIVIFSTHLVEDVNALCNDMAIINQGKVVQKIKPKTALQKIENQIWESKLSPESVDTERCVLLSDRFNEHGQQLYRYHSDFKVDALFEPVQPNLKDFYFLSLKQAQ